MYILHVIFSNLNVTYMYLEFKVDSHDPETLKNKADLSYERSHWLEFFLQKKFQPIGALVRMIRSRSGSSFWTV